MSGNQYRFEIVRDVATLLGKIEPGETLFISVTRHPDKNTDLMDWQSSKGEPCGSSETSYAMSEAYHRKQ